MPISFTSRAVVCLALICFWSQFSNAQSQTNWRKARIVTEREYADDLQNLANELRSNGDSKNAKNVLNVYRPIDPERQYISLPGTAFRTVEAEAWKQKVQQLQSTHAERIFALAKNAIASGDGTSGYQFLHEVLRLNSDHEEVRKILGHRKAESQWRIASELVKSRKATRMEPIMDWPAKSYLRVSTPRFEIHSQADEATTVALATKLERWHNIWRQVFFEFWGNTRTLQKWVDGTGAGSQSRVKYKVIFFKNRESYQQQLAPTIPGIEQSTGYYNDDLEASFFFASEDPSIEETWRHELTHQLFRESRRTQNGFAEGYVWLGEGIAMYMEAMIDFGDYVSIGGFDARRLQYSRIRYRREGFFVELPEISKMSLVEYQTNLNIRRLYAQSAGMCHFLMNAEAGKYRDATIEFLQLMYIGKLREGTFEKVIGLSPEEFRKAYSEYLQTSNHTIEKYMFAPEWITELSLFNSNFSNGALEQIARCSNLTWLDLTDNEITSERLELLSDCSQIQQLFLCNCQIRAGALANLRNFPVLDELDLTHSQCSDAQVLELKGCKRLKTLIIPGTGIADAAISELKLAIPGLNVVR